MIVVNSRQELDRKMLKISNHIMSKTNFAIIDLDLFKYVVKKLIKKTTKIILIDCLFHFRSEGKKVDLSDDVEALQVYHERNKSE